MGFMDIFNSTTPAGMIASAAKGMADGVFSGIDQIIKDFKLPPEQQLAYDSKMAELRVQAEKDSMQFESELVQAVNKTMQEEAKSEHFLQWSWRPLNGYALAIGSLFSVLGTIWLCYQAVIGKDPTALNALPALVTSITMVLAIPGAVCGVTAWHRGLNQIEQTKGQKS